MLKKILHIVVISILALNLMGAWAFASLLDCGMECCKPGEWAGTISYESPSCCQMNDVTCGFETGQYEELFDKVICCFHTAGSHYLSADSLNTTTAFNIPAPTYNKGFPDLQDPSLQNPPIYLFNTTLLC